MQKNMTSLPVYILLFLICFCKSDDRLTPAKPLFPGDKLISNGGVFALGFFSPTNSTANSYVGIWYHNIPERTYVWIANRDNPITSNSSGKLVVTNSSDLVLSDSKGRILWTTKNTITTGGDGAVAVLLNTGNFVLQSPNGTEIWQSYDHPTDIVLPGFKLWTNYKTHIAVRIVAWKGSQDPSTGNFSLSGDPSSGLQIIVLHGATPYWRSGVWNSETASSLMGLVVDDGEEIYATYNAPEGSQRTHWKLDFMGNVRFQIWNNQSSSWVGLFDRPGNGCLHYGSCGPFGYCDITGAIRECKCLDGFEPAGGFHLNFSRGCLRKKVLKCGDEDHFQTLPGMKVPHKFLYIRNRSFEECATECNRSCSCTAYAYANLSNILSRCLVWMGELVDTEKGRRHWREPVPSARRFSGEQQQEEERCGKDCPPNYSMPAATHMHISCQYMQVKRHTTKQGNPE